MIGFQFLAKIMRIFFAITSGPAVGPTSLLSSGNRRLLPLK